LLFGSPTVAIYQQASPRPAPTEGVSCAPAPLPEVRVRVAKIIREFPAAVVIVSFSPGYSRTGDPYTFGAKHRKESAPTFADVLPQFGPFTYDEIFPIYGDFQHDKLETYYALHISDVKDVESVWYLERLEGQVGGAYRSCFYPVVERLVTL